MVPGIDRFTKRVSNIFCYCNLFVVVWFVALRIGSNPNPRDSRAMSSRQDKIWSNETTSACVVPSCRVSKRYKVGIAPRLGVFTRDDARGSVHLRLVYYNQSGRGRVSKIMLQAKQHDNITYLQIEGCCQQHQHCNFYGVHRCGLLGQEKKNAKVISPGSMQLEGWYRKVEEYAPGVSGMSSGPLPIVPLL